MFSTLWESLSATLQKITAKDRKAKRLVKASAIILVLDLQRLYKVYLCTECLSSVFTVSGPQRAEHDSDVVKQRPLTLRVIIVTPITQA